MKFKILILVAAIVAIYSSCKKDLGNYDYNPPSEPTIAVFKDSTFSALLGDSLILKPIIGLEGADPMKDLSFEWRILILEELREAVYTGYPLRMIYNLGPGLRTAKLIITDNRNGLRYVIPFKILGTTAYSTGQLILSDDNGESKLSFVSPDGKNVQADVYKSLNGGSLPANPVEIYFATPMFGQTATLEEYWILCNDPARSSVILNSSTLLKKRDFTSQFFSPPASIVPGHLEGIFGAVAGGVINSKLFVGTTSTAPFAPDYGKFGNEQAGDYLLSKYFSKGSNFFFAYDTKSKGFVLFSGDGSYLGKDYTVDNSANAFDPKNVDMQELLFMQTGEAGTFYAFFKGADGNVYELTFTYQFAATGRKITANRKRIFKGSAQITADTKWQRNSLNVFYFSSNDKVYRYNPLNEEIRALDADFGGKKITMLKISKDDNTLTVGTSGAVQTLDVAVGKNGNIIQTVNGIPGAPVDIVIRK